MNSESPWQQFGFGARQAEFLAALIAPHRASTRWIRHSAELESASPPSDVIVCATGVFPAVEVLLPALTPRGVVIFTRAEDPRLDACKLALRDHGHLGVEAGAAGEVWWGGPSLPTPDPAVADQPLPLIACYFTTNTPYEEEAMRLRASCLAAGVPFEIRGLTTRGSWEANCAMKPGFLLEVWRETGRPLIWVDADAIVHRAPELLRGSRFDFALHKVMRWEFASGTVFFNSTPLAGRLLERWTQLCRRHPHIWDQILLDAAWEETVRQEPLATQWLPAEYTLIFDRPEAENPEGEPVIMHHQASRRLKTVVSTQTPPRPTPEVSEPWRAARREGRRGVDSSGQPQVLPHIASPDYLPFPGTPSQPPPEFAEFEQRFQAWLGANGKSVKRLALFGASWFGARLLSRAREAGIEPFVVFDNQAGAPDRRLLDVPVRLPTNDCENADCVVVASIGHSRAIVAQVAQLTNPLKTRILAAHQPQLGFEA